MDRANTCRFLEWDSEFFGARIASLAAEHIAGTAMDAALNWCRTNTIDCLYLLSGADDVDSLRTAGAEGFRLVDVRVTFEARLDSRPPPAPDAPRRAAPSSIDDIRPSRTSDIPALRAIAAHGHTNSRFYIDGRFGVARCNELYATWIEKSCRGWAEAVLVAELNGAPAGYISCHRRVAQRSEPEPGENSHGEPERSESRHGEIGLVGLAPEAQGRGLGTRLVERALTWFAEQGLMRVTVATQARNIGAQRLYQACGFKTSAVQLWHHRWFTEEPRRP